MKPTRMTVIKKTGDKECWHRCGEIRALIHWWECKMVQFSSVAQSCPSLCDPMNRSTPGLPVHHQLAELTQTHVHRVSDAIQPSHPLSSPSPLAQIPPSIRVFSNESTLCTRWPKYWSFSFSIIPSKEHPGLISSRMDWLYLLAVQGTLRSVYAAAAKSLQSCLTLCDSMDGSPPGCPVPGILQARTL